MIVSNISVRALLFYLPIVSSSLKSVNLAEEKYATAYHRPGIISWINLRNILLQSSFTPNKIYLNSRKQILFYRFI